MVLKRGLIVSCQAAEGEPLFGLGLMRFMARAAKAGGAVGIRALADEIAGIKEETDLPVIGLVKRTYADSDVYITPGRREIDRLIETGCEVIAMDGTLRPRPNGETLADLYAYARRRAPEIELMADCDDKESVLRADALGFDYIGTTLRGYTKGTEGVDIPDRAFLRDSKADLKRAALIAEGGIWETAQLEAVVSCDPYAVVIGTAITRPRDITARFVRIINGERV